MFLDETCLANVVLVLALLEGDFALVLLLDVVNFVFRLEDCWLAAQICCRLVMAIPILIQVIRKLLRLVLDHEWPARESRMPTVQRILRVVAHRLVEVKLLDRRLRPSRVALYLVGMQVLLAIFHFILFLHF